MTMAPSSPPRPITLWVFIDEAGDLNFSPTGTTYFSLTSISTFTPERLDQTLGELRYRLMGEGAGIERFHATEDRQEIRNKVFEGLSGCLNDFRADSIIVEKCKTGPALRSDHRFYPEMLGYLLRYVVNGLQKKGFQEIVVVTDRLPVRGKRSAVEKAIKTTLANMVPGSLPYSVFHFSSSSMFGLQAADYINWAIFRKWERGDFRSYRLISSAVCSEFDIFETGITKWY